MPTLPNWNTAMCTGLAGITIEVVFIGKVIIRVIKVITVIEE